MRFVLFISFIIFMLLGSAQNNDWTTKFESSNFLETTTYDECISFCRKLDEISNLISYLEIGESPQGRSIPMLIVDKDGLTNAQDIRKKGRIILFIQAGIHAGEPDGTDAGFLILRDMVAYNKGINLLENVSILFIPSFNVDGLARMSPYNRINQNGPIEMGWRTNSLNLNLNRDYMKADSPEIRAWLKIFHEYLPDFFIDCHTTDGADYQYIATYSLETFGNMDADLTKWTKDVYETYLQSEMEKNETPIFPYVSFKNWHDPRSGLIRKVGTPMISQGYTALQNRGRPACGNTYAETL
jgi:murein tripeptide amidase MpaA